MEYIIGCDAHKRYSQFVVFDSQGKLARRTRVNHEPGAIHEFLQGYPEGTPVALESIGNWYWIVDEIEAAGCFPLMAHAVKAKVMMGNVNKTDKLDAEGLAILLRSGTLPTVWIPPGKTRDKRKLPRTRMALSKLRTVMKNRIHATLAKYNLSLSTSSDIFAPKWRSDLEKLIEILPPETHKCVQQKLELLDQLQGHIRGMEKRIRDRFKIDNHLQYLKTLPGVGDILSIVIESEIGSIERFPSAENFAGYAGTVPTVRSSGGKVYYGRVRKQSNHTLKWTFTEAANTVARWSNQPGWKNKQVSHLYLRHRRRKGHAIAVGAVAPLLSEAAYWVLKKKEPYKEPVSRKVLPRQG